MNIIKLVIVGFFSLWVVLLSGCASTPYESDVNNSATRARARAHTDLGAAYFQQKKLNIALEEFTLASKIDPSFGFAYNGLGMVNAAIGQDEAADKAFKKAIAIEPTNSEAHNNYGNFLCSRGRYKASIKEYLKAVDNPTYSTPVAAYTNAGVCSVRDKNPEAAEKYFTKALQIDPLTNVAAYQLATIQFKRNDASGAYETLKNALSARPSANMLYLAVQITRRLGLKTQEEQYGVQLFKMYPDSQAAANLKKEMLAR